MEQKSVIITGANSGIGRAAAMRFAREDYSVIMACRSLERSIPVQNDIIYNTGNEKVFLKQVDMSSLASIRSFYDDLIKHFHTIDILVHNAAYFNHGEMYRLSVDNTELTFATNVVGPFLMTMLLMEHMKKSDDARILHASSNIIKHYFSPKKALDLENLHGITDPKYKHSVYASYRNSKMALLMLTFNMASRFKDSGVKVNSIQVNGARMSKETLKRFSPKWRIVAIVQNMFFPAPEFMADVYFRLCTSTEFRNTTGKYFNHKHEIMKAAPQQPTYKDILGSSSYPAYANRSDMQDTIWDMCMNMTESFMID